MNFKDKIKKCPILEPKERELALLEIRRIASSYTLRAITNYNKDADRLSRAFKWHTTELSLAFWNDLNTKIEKYYDANR